MGKIPHDRLRDWNPLLKISGGVGSAEDLSAESQGSTSNPVDVGVYDRVLDPKGFTSHVILPSRKAIISRNRNLAKFLINKIWASYISDKSLNPYKPRNKVNKLNRIYIDKMRAKGYLEPCKPLDILWAVRLFPVHKKGGTGYRIVGDFRPINALFKKASCIYPYIENIWLRVASSTCASSVDLQDGFYQIPLPLMYRKYFGLYIGKETYRFKVLPQGFALSPLVFTQYIGAILKQYNMTQDIIYYMDDIIGLNMDPETLIYRITNMGLQVNNMKTQTSKDGLNIMGLTIVHKENQVFLSIQDDSFNILKARIQKGASNFTQLHAILSSLEYYRGLIPDLILQNTPLYKLRQNRDYNESCTDNISFTIPKLHAKFNIQMPLHIAIYVDASEYGIGLVVALNNQPFYQYFINPKSTTWDKQVGIYRELRGIYMVVNKYKRFLELCTHFYTDSLPLVQGYKKKSMTFQHKHHQKMFDDLVIKNIPLEYVPGEHNLADGISRRHPLPVGSTS